ncbi:hypothetical protein Naga_102000g1, partial [Nannochloropsis gaditana]
MHPIRLLLTTLALAPALATSFAASSLGSCNGLPHQRRQHQEQVMQLERHLQAHPQTAVLPIASPSASPPYFSTSLPSLRSRAVGRAVRRRGGAFASSSEPSEQGRGLLEGYLNALDTRPILTKSLSSGIICALGDVLSQYLGTPFPPALP